MAENDTITNGKSAEQLETENKMSEAEKRIKQLSEKVRLTSEERDEREKLIKEKDNRIAELEKESLFNSGYADILSSHPTAKEHKDEIKSKVLAGYSVEDATFAVLGKAGKLGGASPQPTPQSPAGGSATNQITQAPEKSLKEMTRDEKRAALVERQGEIYDILAPQTKL